MPLPSKTDIKTAYRNHTKLMTAFSLASALKSFFAIRLIVVVSIDWGMPINSKLCHPWVYRAIEQ
jgi:hypothetical protein